MTFLLLFYRLGLKAVYQNKERKKTNKHLYIFITALTNSFQNLFFPPSGVMQSENNRYIYIYILFIVICPISCLLSESTITFHFAQRLLVSIYCIQKKRNMLPSLRAPHLVQLFFLRVNIYLIIYSSVITQVFSNKVFMISYSTRRAVWPLLKKKKKKNQPLWIFKSLLLYLVCCFFLLIFYFSKRARTFKTLFQIFVFIFYSQFKEISPILDLNSVFPPLSVYII